MSRFFGRLLGQYQQDMEGLARRELEDQDITDKTEFLAECYGTTVEQIYADVDVVKARWAASDLARERRMEDRRLKKYLFPKYRNKGENVCDFRKRYLNGGVKLNKEDR